MTVTHMQVLQNPTLLIENLNIFNVGMMEFIIEQVWSGEVWVFQKNCSSWYTFINLCFKWTGVTRHNASKIKMLKSKLFTIWQFAKLRSADYTTDECIQNNHTTQQYTMLHHIYIWFCECQWKVIFIPLFQTIS